MCPDLIWISSSGLDQQIPCEQALLKLFASSYHPCPAKKLVALINIEWIDIICWKEIPIVNSIYKPFKIKNRVFKLMNSITYTGYYHHWVLFN